MDIGQIRRRAWFSGGLIALLGLLGVVMAVLQYQWTGELSRAERERLDGAMRRSLMQLSQELDGEIQNAVAALIATEQEVDAVGREAAYVARYRNWKAGGGETRLFQAVALAIPEGGKLSLKRLDASKGAFREAEWPAHWTGMRNRLMSRINGERLPPMEEKWLTEIPRFGQKEGNGGEQEWLVVEVDEAVIRDVLLPRQVARHLGGQGGPPYEVEVYENGAAAKAIYRAGLGKGESIRGRAAASMGLLSFSRMGGGPGRGRGGMGGGPPGPPGPPMMGGGRRPDHEHGTWQMYVRPAAGSLEALVERTRWRNLAVALTLLALILATALLLAQSAGRAQELAELQMNFVAGVSHELRTPLTVIRTAAFNLRGRVAAQPEQVERYGKLIQEQSEKLGSLVEQVLRYASSRVGQVIQEREAVVIEDVIEGGIRSSQLALESSPYQLERAIRPGLPLVLADERALQHVVQNLLDNAVKYGTETSNWIGVSVEQAGDFLEIKVADRGPGVPAQEQPMIFEPFFRGKRALADQVNGTGLGLSLVKKIVEAHGGTIRVQNHVPQGAEFVVRVPVAPPEMQDEFAHTAG